MAILYLAIKILKVILQFFAHLLILIYEQWNFEYLD